MKLVIGGFAQGKLEYVKANMLKDKSDVVINDFHLHIRKYLQEGKDADRLYEEVTDFIKEHPDTIIICDEIGNGIVPVDPFEREYREKTGRLLIELAKQADKVVRVTCGIGQRIK